MSPDTNPHTTPATNKGRGDVPTRPDRSARRSRPSKSRAAEAAGPMAEAITVPTRIPTARHDLRILRAFRQIVRELDIHSRRLALEHQITAPQLACLTAIAEDGPMTVSHIAERVSLSASTVVGVLDRLEAKGLVERSRDPDDRRVVNVTASGAGRKLIDRAPPLLQERLTTALQQLSDREQARIAGSLERVAALMK